MLAIARFWAVFLGGALFGAGILLHAQVVCLRMAREEVSNTFVVWRFIGSLTFAFQDDLTQAAIWADEVPEAVIRESDRAGWTLMVLGGMGVVGAWFLRRSRRPGH